VLQAKLQERLGDPAPLAALLEEKLEQFLNQTIAALLEQFRKPRWIYNHGQNGLRVELAGAESASSTGLLFKGNLYIDDAGSPSATPAPLSVSPENLKSLGSTPALIVSKSSIEVATQRVSQWQNIEVNMNVVPSFRRLLRSRLFQFFVWPDLLNYPKDAPFTLLAKTTGTPSVRFGDGLNVSVDGSVSSRIISQRDGRSWNYVLANTNARASGTLRVANGRLEVDMDDSSVRSSYIFGRDYTNLFRPTTWFASGIIDDALAERFKSLEDSAISLPEIKLNDDLVLRPQALKRVSPELFFLEWTSIP
jgi:hypothetical protein